MKVDEASVAAPAGSLQDEDDFTTALYRAAIGPVGTARYLPAFSRFEAAGRAGLGWNWAASLLTLNWLMFRQLWAPALGYVGALTLSLLGVFGLGRLVFQMPPELEVALLLMMAVFAFGVPGLFGNAWFYRHCQARVAQALAVHTEVPAACAALNKSASTRPRAIVLAVANVAFIALAAAVYAELSTHTPAHPMLPATSGAAGTSGLQSASGLIGPAPVGMASAPVSTASEPQPIASSPARASSEPASQPASQPAAPATMPASAPAAPTVSSPASAPVANATTTPTKAPVSKASEVKTTTATAPVATAPVAKSPAAKASATKTLAAKPATPKSPATVPAPARDTYLINVGLFAQAQNANAAYAKLMEAGLPATIQPFSTSKGPRIRVRVGPFASQSQAEASAANIRALGLDAIVFKP